jgi:alpha-1,2-glucosyltransferase
MIEPRYFMLPFLLLQLHAPFSGVFCQRHLLSSPLHLYLAVNGMTLALFVYRPFFWPDGSVARFMW